MSSGHRRNSTQPGRPLRLGVLGTLVWDRIESLEPRSEPVEGWGGISYSLEGLSASLHAGAVAVPILKVGEDLLAEALDYLRTIPKLEVGPGIQGIPFPNHRVELRYRNQERVSECLEGGFSPWSWRELEPLLAEIDALYLNFITGLEMALETALRLKEAFSGPLYADLHSLFLGVSGEGRRTPRELPDWRAWLGAFDAVQMNEEEFGLLDRRREDPWRLAAETVGPELKLIAVTLGKRGAGFLTAPGFSPDPFSWPSTRSSTARKGEIRSGRIGPSEGYFPRDPTGCGDVWGATFFARLLAGDALGEAMGIANRQAARNAGHRGARGLHLHLGSDQSS